MRNELEVSLLGKPTHYKDHYDANILFVIPREIKRAEIGIESNAPFYG